MIRSYKTEGIILKRRNLGDSDKIITIFTKNNGKIQIKALGVRKITSRRCSQIELLNYSIFTLYRGSVSFMPILTEAKSLTGFFHLKSDLKKVGFAYYLCELIDSLCPENQENPRVFALLKDALCDLSRSFDNNSIINNFEKMLLDMLGFISENNKQKESRYLLIEQILERKLVTRRFLPLFTS